jgi:murein L,D-transpeptidase YcbB/YkuD
MIRKISPYIIVVVFITVITVHFATSCNDHRNTETKTVRDTSITTANAYSKFFIDSLALEKFITAEVTSDSIASYMRNLYNARNYSCAWFDEDGLTIQAEGFWNAHDNTIKQYSDTSIFDKQLHRVIDTLINDSTFVLPQKLRVPTELRFTKHFFQYVQFAYAGKVDPATVQWHIPRRKLKPLAMLDTLLSSKTGEWKPLSKAYRQLQQVLFRYKEIEREGGWPEVEIINRNVKPGEKSAVLVSLKKRLQATGDYSSNDTSNLYSAALRPIIKKVEASFGLKQDGVIDASLLKHLNVPVSERVKQILVNLERMKWLPQEPDDYIVANIPEYRLHVIENKKEVLGMSIVVGKAANRTVVFSDELQYVVFSPYWNVPKSIVQNEIYPAMQRSNNYLSRNNMEITGYSGGLPLVRQKPGNVNALGQVKFIFPNSYNIYFHDTPSRSLFARQQRAFSHGCIRVHQPYDLAAYLLANQPEWTSEKIKTAMNASTEKWVTLKQPLPVYITYFTAWIGYDGLLHFADDIYGHDERLAEHLFE